MMNNTENSVRIGTIEPKWQESFAIFSLADIFSALYFTNFISFFIWMCKNNIIIKKTFDSPFKSSLPLYSVHILDESNSLMVD